MSELIRGSLHRRGSRMQVMEEKPQLLADSRDPASDEEIARRLQQQLNGEAAAAARRRTRKQPTFYSPQVAASPQCFLMA